MSYWKDICKKYPEDKLLNCYGDIFFIDEHEDDWYIGRRVLWNLGLSKEKYEIRETIEYDSDGEYDYTDYEIREVIMEEKERYGCRYVRGEFDVFIDNETDKYLTIQEVKHLLNQQDKRIKELEEENKKFVNGEYQKCCESCCAFDEQQAITQDYVIENQQLKQQLLEYQEQSIRDNQNWVAETTELQQQLEEAKQNGNYQVMLMCQKENILLNQQLHDLPKKLVEDFYDEIRHRAILEDDYCPDHNLERKYGVRKCLLENIRTTILKKYGGENESE